jgi:hypothetical protein
MIKFYAIFVVVLIQLFKRLFRTQAQENSMLFVSGSASGSAFSTAIFDCDLDSDSDPERFWLSFYF